MQLTRYATFFLLTLLTAATQAAPVTVLLDAEVFSGDFAGATATGTITYDDTAIVDDFINAAAGLEVEFIFFDQTFTESDDIDFDGQPSLVFEDGEIVAFDWVVSEIEGGVLTDIDEPGVFDFSMYTVMVEPGTGPGGEILLSGELSVNDFAVVPLPAAFPLFAAGLGLVAVFRRRKDT